MLEALKRKVYEANMLLVEYGLAPFTWGNASGIDRESGLVVIKPSGVSYSELNSEKMVVVDMDGRVVEGSLRPSSDTATHIELYKAFEEIGAVVHTHSRYATVFAQAGRGVPAYGTTHADFAPCEIPCTRALTEAEIKGEYEKNTGLVIAECFSQRGLRADECQAVLVKSHGPFTWGDTPKKAAENAAVLEIISEMALNTELLASADKIAEVDSFLLQKHYQRKHGKNAYYGQK